MKTAILAFLILAHLPHMVAQNSQSESPYFHVTTPSAKEGSMPLEKTSADVTIIGPIADVTITQTYRNNGELPIEAIYVFPASTRAAVYAMEMKIGSRRVVAEIQEKDQARRTYETAKEQGKRTSLLEQHRPNVFQMEVANILPGERIDVILKYTEFIVPEEQQYTFVYPTVVGPRYVSQSAEPVLVSSAPKPKGIWGHTVKSSTPTYNFDITVNVEMPVAINRISCSTHKMNIHRPTVRSASMQLHPAESNSGNRDVSVEYQLAGGEVLTGIMTYDNGEEQFFLCQVEPPSRSADFEIVPREFIFVVDVSGSMHGFPLEVSKKLMNSLFRSLRATDKFNVLCFAGGSYTMFQRSVFASPENVNYAFQQLNSMQGGGGTELLPALRSAMSIPKDDGYSRSFVIATDGYVMVEEQAFRYIETHLNQANFFSFGIGSSVNRHLIEGMAHAGRGEPFILLDQTKADEVAGKLRKYIEAPVLTDISVIAQNVTVHDVVPSSVPDLLAERPLYIFGKYDDNTSGTLTISGRQGDRKFTKTLDLPAPEKANSALSYLWARERLRSLSDLNSLYLTEERKEEIVEIGLKYNLLTEFTSFVAVDEEIVTEGLPVRKDQPLPLPYNVSQYAIGFSLELDPIVEGGKPALFNVDVHCAHDEAKLLTETVLEIIFDKVKHSVLHELVDMHVDIKYSVKEGLTLKSGNKELWEIIQDDLESAFVLLGLSSRSDIHLVIETSYFDNCK